MAFFWVSNGLAIVLICFLVGFSWYLNRGYKGFTTLNITLLATLVALSIVLTNVIGYNLRFLGIQLTLGNFVLFLLGMLLGPLPGVVSGIIGDSIGALINISGSYHANFLLAKALFGFLGGLVFLKSDLFLRIRFHALILCACFFTIFLLNPIGLWSVLGWKGVYAQIILTLPQKTLTFAIQGIAYPFLILSSFRILSTLYRRSNYVSQMIWAFKNENFLLFEKRTFKTQPQPTNLLSTSKSKSCAPSSLTETEN